MMEMVPFDTADKVFNKPKYQEIEYIKPYLIDVFQKI